MSQAQDDAPFKIHHEKISGDGWTWKYFEDQNQFYTTLDIIKDKGVEYETTRPDGKPDGGSSKSSDGVEAEVVDHTESAAEKMENGHSDDSDDSHDSDAQSAQVVEPTDTVEPEQLSKDPIGFLRSVNTDFVNTIKGKPAISKQGFRFIQREFEISTQSEVVEMVDDPLGCIVWAKAELPGGYSAEAHGEGYQFESDVSDNEFVRYADTRAKNRAISDLTSAGALAVSELQPEQ